jgi:CheY-like chemotaxis protein
MLQRLGHDVSQAENGSIALDMLRDRQFKNEKQFDILFLDKYVFANFSSSSHWPSICVYSQMPVMSGVETARELRRIGCPIFIVGATGNALKEDQEEVGSPCASKGGCALTLSSLLSSQYIEAGADQVLTKPVKQPQMQAMLEQARSRVAGETQPKTDATLRLSEPQVWGSQSSA